MEKLAFRCESGGEVFWYIAQSAQEALKFMRQWYEVGELDKDSIKAEMADTLIEQLPSDQKFCVVNEEDDEETELTWAEWAEREPKGLLVCSVY